MIQSVDYLFLKTKVHLQGNIHRSASHLTWEESEVKLFDFLQPCFCLCVAAKEHVSEYNKLSPQTSDELR